MDLSSDLAYIFGVLYGDGYLTELHGKKGNWKGIIYYRIGLQCKDKEFAQKFADCLNNEFNLSLEVKPYLRKYKNEKLNYFQVYCYSKEIVQHLLEIKEGAFASLITNPKEIICEFLKGLFDSEGSASFRKDKYCRSIKLAMKEDKEFFNYISKLLRKVGIISFKSYTLKDRGLIEIGNKKDFLTFYKNINFTIFRKLRIMQEIINSYTSKQSEIRVLEKPDTLLSAINTFGKK